MEARLRDGTAAAAAGGDHPSAAETPSPASWARRETLIVAIAACALAVVMNWPLVPHVATDLPAVGFGDPYVQAWHVAWEGHVLRNDPGNFFESNAFWPLDHALAFEDALIGYAPAGLIGEGADAALLRFNLLFLFAHALPFVGGYLLAREIGLGWAGSTATAMAFAFAPWRLDQYTHLNVLSSGGIPLSLFLLLRGVKRESAGYALAGWIVATWQLSLGFSLGIHFSYLLLVLGGIWMVRVVRSRTRLGKRFIAATLLGGALFAAWGLFQVSPYLQVRENHPEAQRFEAEIDFYSPPPQAFLAASDTNIVWGDATRTVRDELEWPSEQTLFPGAAIVVAAVIGIGSPIPSRLTRASLLAGCLGLGALALGTSLSVIHPLYNALFRFAPGWDAIRTPGRLMTLVSLGLALLAGAGVDLLARSRLGRRRWLTKFPIVVAFLLIAAIALEGAGTSPHQPATRAPVDVAGLEDPVMFLPSDDVLDRRYMFWSTDDFPRIPNGAGSFTPTALGNLRESLADFPDAGSVASLQRLGVRTVVLDRRLALATPWASAADRSVGGLPVERINEVDAVIYRIRDGEDP